MGYLYRHIRLDTNEVFYIGVSCSNDYRYKRAKEKCNRNPLWNNIVTKTQYSVEIVLEDLTDEALYEKEVEFIKLYGRRDLGTGTLVNMSDGGEIHSRKKLTQEHRANIGKAGKGRKHSKETKLKISESNKGKTMSKESIEKMRQSKVGKKRSPEAIESWRKAVENTVWNFSEEALKKRSENGKRNKGRKASEATKNLMSSQRKRGKHSLAIMVLDVEMGIFYDCLKDACESRDLDYERTRRRLKMEYKYNYTPFKIL